jgi:hypothetical protein
VIDDENANGNDELSRVETYGEAPQQTLCKAESSSSTLTNVPSVHSNPVTNACVDEPQATPKKSHVIWLQLPVQYDDDEPPTPSTRHVRKRAKIIVESSSDKDAEVSYEKLQEHTPSDHGHPNSEIRSPMSTPMAVPITAEQAYASLKRAGTRNDSTPIKYANRHFQHGAVLTNSDHAAVRLLESSRLKTPSSKLNPLNVPLSIP